MITPIKISPFARRSSGGGFAPSNTVAPEITGTLEVGETLTCSTGTWTGTPTITYSYQWKRGATNIGTNSATYTQVYADLNQNITCTVTATNGAGSSSQVSNTVVTIFNRLSHGLKWAVDTENMTEIGTTTTLIDYFGNNSLANVGASQQPTTVAAQFGSKSILRFTTDDILTKSVSNWFAADTSGQITLVVKSNTTVFQWFFGSSDTASTKIWDVRKQATTNQLAHLHNVGDTVSGTLVGTQNLGTSLFKVVTIASNGTVDKMYVNGVAETISSGTLGGKWLADFPTQRDNITLGGIIFSATGYSNIDVYGAYYGAFNETNILNLHANLMAIGGL